MVSQIYESRIYNAIRTAYPSHNGHARPFLKPLRNHMNLTSLRLLYLAMTKTFTYLDASYAAMGVAMQHGSHPRSYRFAVTLGR